MRQCWRRHQLPDDQLSSCGSGWVGDGCCRGRCATARCGCSSVRLLRHNPSSAVSDFGFLLTQLQRVVLHRGSWRERRVSVSFDTWRSLIMKIHRQPIFALVRSWLCRSGDRRVVSVRVRICRSCIARLPPSAPRLSPTPARGRRAGAEARTNRSARREAIHGKHRVIEICSSKRLVARARARSRGCTRGSLWLAHWGGSEQTGARIKVRSTGWTTAERTTATHSAREQRALADPVATVSSMRPHALRQSEASASSCAVRPLCSNRLLHRGRMWSARGWVESGSGIEIRIARRPAKNACARVVRFSTLCGSAGFTALACVCCRRCSVALLSSPLLCRGLRSRLAGVASCSSLVSAVCIAARTSRPLAQLAAAWRAYCKRSAARAAAVAWDCLMLRWA